MTGPRNRAVYRVRHVTRYSYSSTVTSCHQLVHLKPRVTPWQSLHSHSIEVSPSPDEQRTGEDYFGNSLYRFAVHSPHDDLIVRAESVVEVLSHAPTGIGPRWERALQTDAMETRAPELDVIEYRVASPMVPMLPEALEYARPSFPAGRPWLEAVLELTRRIRQDFLYDPEATVVSTQVADVLRHRHGVCQDFAHLMISCLRSLGLPARYVSGYVLNLPGSEEPMAGADASHAWVAAHCPALGWVAFDPTNGKLADLEFVTLGWGREFFDVTPICGVVLGAASEELSVAVRVEPLQ